MGIVMAWLNARHPLEATGQMQINPITSATGVRTE